MSTHRTLTQSTLTNFLRVVKVMGVELNKSRNITQLQIPNLMLAYTG